jgi:NAD(P)-dependent dehydrogenase (short-subunit alcohol dehydrogenase family)
MILSGKIAVVTGAARGIGKAIALELGRNGAFVFVLDIQGEKARETAEEIKTFDVDSEAIKVDVTSFIQAQQAINSVIAKFGKIDILVNTAGRGQRKPFLEVTEEIWDETFAVNCKSVFNFCSAAAKPMVNQKEGCIISISSVAAIRGGGLLSKNAYVAAKGAIISFTKALARELAIYNIRVNCIAPGFHITPATENIAEDDKDWCLKQIPLMKAGKPKDLAQAVVFLASPAANFITGTTLVIDGGYATL